MDFKKILFLISLILVATAFAFAGGGPQRPSIPVPIEQGGTGVGNLASLTTVIASSGALLKVNDLSDLNNAGNARNNLGLPSNINQSTALASSDYVDQLRTDSNASDALTVYLDGSRTITATNTFRSQLGIPNHNKIIVDSAGNASFPGQIEMAGASMTQNLVLNLRWLSGDGDNEGVFVNSFGKVGIGTSSPAAKLDIVGAGSTLSGTSNYVARVFQDTSNYRGIGFGYDSSGQIGVIFADTYSEGSNIAFWTYSGAAWGERLRIRSDGIASFSKGIFLNGGADTVASTALVTALRADIVASDTLLATRAATILTLATTTVTFSGFTLSDENGTLLYGNGLLYDPTIDYDVISSTTITLNSIGASGTRFQAIKLF